MKRVVAAALSAGLTAYKIQKLADQRGITHLVHFTRLRSLIGIAKKGRILSTKRLLRERPRAPTNDPKRLDKQLDYVCCSIQAPNAVLLHRYLQRFPDADWVVLYLSLDPLFDSTTKFSPVNAATGGGKHVTSGFKGFRSLFAEKVTGASHTSFRTPHHLQRCPTDIQAEVLVRKSIPVASIMNVFVKDKAARKTIRKKLKDPGLLVEIEPTLFMRNQVLAKVQGWPAVPF